MTETALAPPDVNLIPPRYVRPAPRVKLYPLQTPLLIVGVAAAAVALVIQDPLMAMAVFCLFALVGASWRADMLPIMPACIAFQWVSATTGYFYFINIGHYPGGGYPLKLGLGLVLSMAGLGAIVAGLRLCLWIFRKRIFAKTLATPALYNIPRVFALTLALFAVSYFVNILPKQIWLGGAQIIETFLSLRFVPYFLLLVAVFQRGKGFSYAVAATLFVIGPQLLTGFSDFKEILFVIVIAALAQWRPWIRTRQQQRENRRIMTLGVVMAVLIAVFGVVWSGGLKGQWRDHVWKEDAAASPIEKLVIFGQVVETVLADFNVSNAVEQLAARLSSGALYFSFVLEHVPRSVPHEHGLLLGKAIANATQPRFLFPHKADLGGDSWLVRKYAGVAAAGDESGASIGLGYMAEFYIDFGIVGLIVLAFVWGGVGGGAMTLLARTSPSREIFLAITIGLFTQFYMGFDSSFIKLLAGLLQRLLVASLVFVLAGRQLQTWMTTGRRLTPQERMMRRMQAGAPAAGL